MARKKRTKKVTVAELQSYIQGAIDLNDESWHPDKTQWENIVDMIMNVKADPPVEKVVQQPMTQPQGYQQPMAPPSNMDVEGPTSSPSQRPSSFDLREQSGYKIEKTGPRQRDEQAGVTKSGITVKTPDVDSPVYDTPFT